MANHMTSRYGGQQGSFAESLAAFAENTKAVIDEVFRSVVIEIGTSVVILSPVDTGRFKGNWQLTIDQPSLQSLDRYDKAGHETIAELVAQANQLEAGQVAYIVNNLVYGIPLEYGHSDQAPAGMVQITLARFQQIVEEAIRNTQA
ncbi:HK97 gp10 family phage protein [Pseudomonas viridiflava]|uniref:HK97 gp10 family phage protein n=1 Tax=Pseudomonas viridiflava TaxID=33069 RepID=UPI001FD204AD|nr:HK97 gp10 family phage protein [Pseudomonas viridiflava]